MTRLARAGKCGAGRIPLNGLAVLAVVPAEASRVSRPDKAAPPSPNANRPKNCRRFIAKLMWVQFMRNHSSSLIYAHLRTCQDESFPFQRVFVARVDKVSVD